MGIRGQVPSAAIPNDHNDWTLTRVHLLLVPLKVSPLTPEHPLGTTSAHRHAFQARWGVVPPCPSVAVPEPEGHRWAGGGRCPQKNSRHLSRTIWIRRQSPASPAFGSNGPLLPHWRHIVTCPTVLLTTLPSSHPVPQLSHNNNNRWKQNPLVPKRRKNEFHYLIRIPTTSVQIGAPRPAPHCSHKEQMSCGSARTLGCS